MLFDFVLFDLECSKEATLLGWTLKLFLFFLLLGLLLEHLVQSEHVLELRRCCDPGVIARRLQHLLGLLFSAGIVLLI
jgi:hypothetical protein